MGLIEEIKALSAMQPGKTVPLSYEQVQFNGPMDTQQMPFYYNALGEKQVNYAAVYGPHYGKVCECEECVKFNADMQNREEQHHIQYRIHHDAQEIMRSYYGNPSRSMDGRVDINIVISMMREFACKHIAEYQKDMVKKVHRIQISHTSEMRAMRSKLAEKRIDLPVHNNHKGRLFREGEKGEAA
jgi:hypothetical protein